ncbi:MAG: hypothetical protein EON53_13810 [Actinomycetales bacterium]|nr:MAG: hypothetical protein EON53_13810 [Actinomycetales bacterium]
MLLGDDYQAASVAGDRVRQASSEVVVIGATVLVLDNELRAVLALGDDVDAATPGGKHLGLAHRRQIDSESVSEIVELISEEWREV